MVYIQVTCLISTLPPLKNKVFGIQQTSGTPHFIYLNIMWENQHSPIAIEQFKIVFGMHFM